jgi:hypothetical protein
MYDHITEDEMEVSAAQSSRSAQCFGFGFGSAANSVVNVLVLTDTIPTVLIDFCVWI